MILQYIGLENISAISDTYFGIMSKSHVPAIGIVFSYMCDQQIVFVVIGRLARNQILDFAGVARATRYRERRVPMSHSRIASIHIAAIIAVASISVPAFAQQEPCIGNSVALTGPAAFGGLAVKYGAEVAIDEINEKGGVLGKKLSLIQYDDAGAPPRGVDNVRRIALSDKCVAILGGYHSTVGLAQVDAVNEIGIPWIGTTGANTKIIENGKSPNYMFRVSMKDKWAPNILLIKPSK